MNIHSQNRKFLEFLTVNYSDILATEWVTELEKILPGGGYRIGKDPLLFKQIILYNISVKCSINHWIK